VLRHFVFFFFFCIKLTSSTKISLKIPTNHKLLPLQISLFHYPLHAKCPQLLHFASSYRSHNLHTVNISTKIISALDKQGKPFSLQAWSGPESSRKLRFPDFVTTAQDGGKVVSLTHRPPLPQKMLLVLISVRG